MNKQQQQQQQQQQYVQGSAKLTSLISSCIGHMLAGFNLVHLLSPVRLAIISADLSIFFWRLYYVLVFTNKH